MLNYNIHFWRVCGECCQLKLRLEGFVGKPLATRIGRLKMLMLSDPVIPIMGMNPKGVMQNKATDLHTRMFVTALFIFTYTRDKPKRAVLGE